MATSVYDRPAAPYRQRTSTRLVAILLILGLELVFGWASVIFSPDGASVSAYWPNAGLSVLALCLARPRWRPWIVVAILPVSMAANLLGGRPMDIVLGLGAVNVVEAVVVFRLLTLGREEPRLRTLEDFGRLTAAALVGAVVGALIAGGTIAGLGDGDFAVVTRAVFASHAAALLIIAPLGMRLARHPRRPAGSTEAVAQWALLLVCVVAIYLPGQELPLGFLPFPLLVWGAARLRPRETALQLIVYAGLTAALTTAGHGPFVAGVEASSFPPELIGTLLTANLLAAALVVTPLSLVKTQQLKTLDRLTHSHDLVTNILGATTGNAIVGTDLAGGIEFFNVGAERLTGYPADEVTGKAALDIAVDAERRLQVRVAVGETPDTVRLQGLVEPFLRDPQLNLSADWELLCRDGSVRTVSIAISRRFDEDGTKIGYLGVAEDVTERRHEEAAVQAALENERQTVERLAQVDQTKNDFLATVTHELRTPITSILGYSQLLLSDDTGTLPAMHHQVVGRIERNGRRLMGLIEDMLTMSQVEVGNFRFNRVPMDLREPAQGAIEAAQPALAAGSLALEDDLGPTPVEVLGDADKLERVFGNLLSNAVKFSHRGDTIVVRLGVEGDRAVFTVTDTGLGIGLEDQPHLFDRFYRGADAHALAIQGVGLGLPIASSIVGGHDGRIDVVSEPGRGSTFVVRLPLLGAADPAAG